MPMKNPLHPCLGIKENCLDPLGVNVIEASRILGVARHTLSRVLHGHAAISPEMAVRLEKAGWSNAEFWLRRQANYDLAQVRRTEDELKVERFRPQPYRLKPAAMGQVVGAYNLDKTLCPADQIDEEEIPESDR